MCIIKYIYIYIYMYIYIYIPIYIQNIGPHRLLGPTTDCPVGILSAPRLSSRPCPGPIGTSMEKGPLEIARKNGRPTWGRAEAMIACTCL